MGYSQISVVALNPSLSTPGDSLNLETVLQGALRSIHLHPAERGELPVPQPETEADQGGEAELPIPAAP